MLSHVFTSVTDFERAYLFYQAVFNELGIEQRFHDPATPWAGWHSAGGERPLFVICKPYNGQPHEPGNGQMVAFTAPRRTAVRSAYAIALAHGGSDEGLPGLRPHYHDSYYACYVRDPEGNKICIVCHGAEDD